MDEHPSCWFEYLGGCDGRLVKAHLIPKQRIVREIPLRRMGVAERRRELGMSAAGRGCAADPRASAGIMERSTLSRSASSPGTFLLRCWSMLRNTGWSGALSEITA
jgi:hypothetical protein